MANMAIAPRFRAARLAITGLLFGVQVLSAVDTGSAASAAGPTTVVAVTTVGGFVAPSWQASRLPQLSISSDGVSVVENQKPVHGYIRQAWTTKLSSVATSAFVAKLASALQTPVGGWGMPPVADMPNTRFVVVTGGKKMDVTVGAFSYQGNGLTSAQTKARKSLNALLVGIISSVTRAKTAYKPSKYEIWGLSPFIDNGGVGIANPATVYCQSSGGTSNMVDTPDGQAGFCQLPSGENVDEWANYRAALAALPSWPTGVAVPANNPNDMMMTCTAVAASRVSKQIANKDDGGRWLLPSGQALPVVLRPVLAGESACHRTW